jgi:hypothetical protein
MRVSEQTPRPRRDLHRERDADGRSTDGSYACLDDSWDEIDGNDFGLSRGSRGRCEGAE